MPEADWASWPLVHVRAEGTDVDAGRRLLMDTLLAALDRVSSSLSWCGCRTVRSRVAVAD